jgi:hypothetical protein
MTLFWKAGLLGLTILGFTACGPMQEGNSAVGIMNSVIRTPSGGEGETPNAPGSLLTREFIEAQDTDLLQVSIVSRDAAAILIKGGTNGTKTTWLSPDGIGLVFDGGLLIGSRGLGDDLMGADIATAKSSLNGGGTHRRTLEFITGVDQIERRTFRCVTAKTGVETLIIFERDYDTLVLEESCIGDSGDFKNTYWLDRNSVIWRSRQWISASVGYLDYHRL